MKIINYADYKYSYVHALEPKLKKINYLANVKKMPVNYMCKMVLNILSEGNVKYTEKEVSFVSDIRSCFTSDQIYYRVKNAINYTRANVFVKVDDDGNLIKEL